MQPQTVSPEMSVSPEIPIPFRMLVHLGVAYWMTAC
jgi:hypothetical protein